MYQYNLAVARLKKGTAQGFRQANSVRIFTNLCWYYYTCFTSFTSGRMFPPGGFDDILDSSINQIEAANLDILGLSIPYLTTPPGLQHGVGDFEFNDEAEMLLSEV